MARQEDGGSSNGNGGDRLPRRHRQPRRMNQRRPQIHLHLLREHRRRDVVQVEVEMEIDIIARESVDGPQPLKKGGNHYQQQQQQQ